MTNEFELYYTSESLKFHIFNEAENYRKIQIILEREFLTLWIIEL